MDPLKRATRLGYWIGGSLCAAGLIILSISLGLTFRKAAFGIQRCALPGQYELKLNEPGVYYGIYRTDPKNPVSMQALSKLSFILADPGKLEVPLVPIPPGVMMSIGKDTGLPIFQFEIQRTGTYTLAADYQMGFKGPNLEVWVIHEAVGESRAELIVGFIFFLAFCAGGIYMIIRGRSGFAVKKPSVKY